MNRLLRPLLGRQGRAAAAADLGLAERLGTALEEIGLGCGDRALFHHTVDVGRAFGEAAGDRVIRRRLCHFRRKEVVAVHDAQCHNHQERDAQGADAGDGSV